MPSKFAANTTRTSRIAGIHWTEPLSEPTPGLGEGVIVHDDPLLDGLVGGEVVVFGPKLAIEPAGHITQRLPMLSIHLV